VKIILRADSGFCRWKMLRWCERRGVGYIVGLAKNERLNALSAKLQKRAERKHHRSGGKVRLFTQFKYRAKTWDKKRRVIAKAEHNEVPIRVTWSPIWKVAPRGFTTTFTVLGVRWRIGSKNNSLAS
jgi:hypothetical protein